MKKSTFSFVRLAPAVLALIFGLSSLALAIEGDIGGNGTVDMNDIDILSEQWLNTNCSGGDWCSGADINHSGNVDFDDFALLARNWLKSGPDKSRCPRPFNTQVHVSINAHLSWTAGEGATSHDVYFGTDSTPDAGEFIQNQTGTTYDPGTMNYETTYYWRIDEKNDDGTTIGDIWSFTTGIDYPDISWNTIVNQSWDPPARLDDFVGVHPRYLLTAADVNDLKIKITSGTHQYIWNDVVKRMADMHLGYLASPPYWWPPNCGSEGEMRNAGRGVPWLALAYLLTEDPNYLEAAREWMITVCECSDWDGGESLGAGECLVGISVGYDWLHNALAGDPNMEFIRDKLEYQANRMKNYPPKQNEKYLANHNHVEYNGLAAAGFVLYDDANAPDAINWIKHADLVFQTTFLVASNEGSSTEGQGYWGYSMESLLCFMEAARDLMDKDYYDSQWIEGAMDFIIFSTIPDFNELSPDANYSNCVMSYGDSYRDYRSHGPTHSLCLLASVYNNGYAQWLTEEMLARGIGTTDIDFRAWGNLLWYDETVTATALSGLPTFKHFEDTGWVTSRSGWDEDAVMVGFKCGPFHGHKVQSFYEKYGSSHLLNGGHGQPDVDSFQIYAHGKWLATEPGYSKYTPSGLKYTYDHCAILAGGLGQWGEGGTWFKEEDVIAVNGSSTIIKAENTIDYDYIIGDAENIYRSSSLDKFYRHFVYIKPNLVVIADELEASASSNYFEWRLRTTHTRSQFIDNMNIVKENDDYYIIENNNDSDIVVMDVHFIHPGLEGFSTSTIGTAFLKANFNSTGSDLLATVLHPRRDEEDASSIVSSSFVDSVLYLTIDDGAQVIDVALDLLAQEVYIY